MNKMTGIFCNILECSLKTRQHITVLSRSVKFKVLSTSWTTSEQATWRRWSDKVTLLDALKKLEVVRKCMCQFGIKDNIVTMCNKIENKLYRLKSWRKRKTNIYWVVKYINTGHHLTISHYHHNISMGYWVHFMTSNLLLFVGLI